jgi:osmotically-inducible protein OsmY
MGSDTSGSTMNQQPSGTTQSGSTMGGTTSGSSGSVDTADADIKLTKDLRKAINDMPGLSTMAKRVTISTSAGKVLIKGNVKSEAERTKIIDAAKKLAGEGNVDDQITVNKAAGAGAGTGGGTQKSP